MYQFAGRKNIWKNIKTTKFTVGTLLNKYFSSSFPWYRLMHGEIFKITFFFLGDLKPPLSTSSIFPRLWHKFVMVFFNLTSQLDNSLSLKIYVINLEENGFVSGILEIYLHMLHWKVYWGIWGVSYSIIYFSLQTE